MTFYCFLFLPVQWFWLDLVRVLHKDSYVPGRSGVRTQKKAFMVFETMTSDIYW